MLSEPNISYKPFWGICRPLNSWRANSPNPIQIYCARRIRQFENVKKASIPILAMTANGFEEDKKMAMEAGMNGHISKPIDVNVLENEIINIFKKVS